MDEKNKYRSATITVVANGFIVNIGCQTIVAETPERLRQLINDYLDDPAQAEKRLYAHSIQQGGSCDTATPQTVQPTLAREGDLQPLR